jgi:hypothetical protein
MMEAKESKRQTDEWGETETDHNCETSTKGDNCQVQGPEKEKARVREEETQRRSVILEHSWRSSISAFPLILRTTSF